MCSGVGRFVTAATWLDFNVLPPLMPRCSTYIGSQLRRDSSDMGRTILLGLAGDSFPDGLPAPRSAGHEQSRSSRTGRRVAHPCNVGVDYADGMHCLRCTYHGPSSLERTTEKVGLQLLLPSNIVLGVADTATSFEVASLMAFLTEFAFVISTGATKISVLLFYRRVTKGTISRPVKFAVMGGIAYVVIYTLLLTLLLVLQCNPTNAYWKSYSIGYSTDWHCIDIRWMNPVSGALSTFSDLYVTSTAVESPYQIDLLTPNSQLLRRAPHGDSEAF